MKLTIESTDGIVYVEGVPCRLWRGMTDNGIPALVYVHRVAVAESADRRAFEVALSEVPAPARLVFKGET